MGVRHAGVARHCLWEGHRCPCVHGGSRLWVGPLLCPWVLSVVGAGWSFCLWVTSFVGAGSLSVGAGSLFVGPGLLIVGGGARSRGCVVHGHWFVVCGRGGDVSCAGWGDISCAGWSPLARWDGMKVGLLTKQQQRTTTSSLFVVWLPCRSQRRGTCKRLHPSRSVVMWHGSYLLWWLWAWAMDACGGHG